MVLREHVLSYAKYLVHLYLFDKVYGGESPYLYEGPIHQFGLSNSSMLIILFLYITYYEQVMNENIDRDSSLETETFL